MRQPKRQRERRSVMKIIKLRTGWCFLGTLCILSLIFTLVTFFATVPSTASEWKWPASLTIGTIGVGSSSHALSAGWGAVLENKTGCKVRVLPEDSMPLLARWNKSGELDLYLGGIPSMTEVIEAKGGNATRDGGPYPMRVVWIGQTIASGYPVVRDSEIKTINDIKPGHKFGVWIGSELHKAYYNAMLAYLQYTPKELPMIPFGSYAESVKAIGTGKVDFARTANTSSVTYEIAAGPHGIRFLEFPEGAKEAEARLASVMPMTMYGRANYGVKESRGVRLQIEAFPYVTPATTNTELVYHLVKWLNENFDAYKDKHEAIERMHISVFRVVLDSIFLPIHEGTIKYLKEVGIWTAADDARQEYNKKLVMRYEEAYKSAIEKADKKGIKVEPRNKEWVELWESYKNDLKLPRFKVMREIPK
jgi:TRAP transporter TAXI family solute receptor